MKMCQRLMGSIDLSKQARGEYTSKQAFDVHPTTRHSVADPYRDQLKGAWFCLNKGLLDPTKFPEKLPLCYPIDGLGSEGGPVSKCYLDIEEKGVAKVTENFKSKLYHSFPDLRYQLLLGG